MQESWKFIIDSKSAVADEHIIRNLIKEHSREMGIFLSYYFKNEGAVVENVTSDEVKISIPGKGKVKVIFDLIHYNACLNINDQRKDQMKIDYLIENNKVILTGPYWPERGQDEI
ncbi:hypothetical protein [Anditalea andensis]|uniref:Uncharacterized protein n=1 Tax=Anditalea andensis TaxID=1048983 RepID=A0A074LJL2_9BACT|nr:hypothetical protein [Anditalea andensis]KEO73992.1 hypothetical protein EL17_07520 [Anditalea andensis]